MPVSEKDVESFKKLGAEVRIHLPGTGDVVLVPKYTGQDRDEVSIDDVFKISMLRKVFPGIRPKWDFSLRRPMVPEEIYSGDDEDGIPVMGDVED